MFQYLHLMKAVNLNMSVYPAEKRTERKRKKPIKKSSTKNEVLCRKCQINLHKNRMKDYESNVDDYEQ